MKLCAHGTRGADASDGGLFAGDGLSNARRPSRVYSGGTRSGAVKAPKKGPSKSEVARAKRGGKGKHAFKSKAKHQRRR